MKSKHPTPFDKHDYYARSVQEPNSTLGFVRRVFRKEKGREAVCFGEDFCGTFLLSQAWVTGGPRRTAVAVDLDANVVRYGVEHHLATLPEADRDKLLVYQCDVRDDRLPVVDCIGAFNFSYFIFHKRADLLGYFRNCRRRVSPNGMFFLDCFGGYETMKACEESTHYDGFTYSWDQKGFDPITHRALFYIHYKRKGEARREKVFTYDWRMWTLPELRDLLEEAGFKKVRVYWETCDKDGEGTGNYREQRTPIQNDPAWVCYIVAD